MGIGKIARDQHLPAIKASDQFALVAAASHHGRIEGVSNYSDIETLVAGNDRVAAVALCQPPQSRFHAARVALEAGLHVLLEKPPTATLGEIDHLVGLARDRRLTLFASWHSQHALGISPARAWLGDKSIRRVSIVWKEDVRQWHPGQAWIWEPGGLGVFDPGINALSIATRILPPFWLDRGTLAFPSNRAAPIAAALQFSSASGARIELELDWRQTGPQVWNIEIDTDAGHLTLSRGGAAMAVNGVAQPLDGPSEYASLYARFAALIAQGESEVDVAPFRHVADAYLRCRRVMVDAFED